MYMWIKDTFSFVGPEKQITKLIDKHNFHDGTCMYTLIFDYIIIGHGKEWKP